MAYATAVHRTTGQWWTFPIRNGDFEVKGLLPGKYRIEVPAMNGYLAAVIRPSIRVRPDRASHVALRLTTRGGTFEGQVVDRDTDVPIADAWAAIYDGSGAQVAEARTDAAGFLRLGGAVPGQGNLTVVVQAFGDRAGRTYSTKVELTGQTLRNGLVTPLGRIDLVADQAS